ncbi:hypothetical protein [Alkalinema sp. FACHB-956]|uniref:hypothetical protein n=1 Tax=Alkalinema sp. FACHB-956 TaxID=2692768 RepID=UPI001689CC97|nr:hypothetical protein [Alkalinema sp. FACHB-956]MBD2327044.1 hypothetical protein [Alkalinema sp. FACHB-956]
MTRDVPQPPAMGTRNETLSESLAPIGQRSEAALERSQAVTDWFKRLDQLHVRQDDTDRRLTRLETQLETQLQSIAMTTQSGQKSASPRSYRSSHAKAPLPYSAPVQLSFLSLKWMFFFVTGLSLVLLFSAGFGAANPAIGTWVGLMKTLLTPLAIIVLMGWFITVVQESFK